MNSATKLTMQLLEQNTFSNNDRQITWTMHDAIVDHAKREAVTRDEAFLIIKAMQKLFPIMLHRRAAYYRIEQKEMLAPNATEFEFFAIDENKESYVWCSIYIPDDPSFEHCETCIADETISNLEFHLSRYL